MKTINTKFDSLENLKAFVQKHDITSHKEILLQVFTGNCNESFIKMLIKQMLSLVPHIKIIGSTTDGEILSNAVSEFETILSFSLFEETHIETYTSQKTNTCSDTAKNLISQFPTDKRARVAISFADGIDTNGEAFLNAFHDYDKELVLSGGLAGDNAEFIQTTIFTEKEILHTGAVIALLYNDDLIVHTQANFGWKSIGKTLKVTKADYNVVYEIDGMTPVDLYAKYLGKTITSQLPKTGIEFPLIMRRGDLDVARAVIGKNDDGSLVFAGNISVGDKVKFGYGNVESIVSGGNKVYEDMAQVPVQSIFIYSCMARKALMGKSIVTELQLLNTIAPLSGFFTYGEFYTNQATSTTELLNQTMTILSLSEKNEIIEKEYGNYKMLESVDENITAVALSHLIAQTSLELEEINNTLEEKVKDELIKNRAKDQQLLQQSRMAQMGEMISMIAHQWRQPLGTISSTVINMQIKLMTGQFSLQSQEGQKECETFFQEKLSNIETYVQDLSTTIDDFRNFYKPNKAKKRLLIQDPIEKSLNIVEASMKSHGIMIEKNYESKKAIMIADSELMQVFLNLFKNAQDNFIEKNIQDASIMIKTADIKEGVVVEICDNGGGIPETIIEKIFDPYFSTKDEKNGTGLGLYMSKTIIEEHHKGSLSVENKESGVCFRVLLEA